MHLLATTADVCSILGLLMAVAMALWDRVKGCRPAERKEEDAEAINEVKNEKK